MQPSNNRKSLASDPFSRISCFFITGNPKLTLFNVAYSLFLLRLFVLMARDYFLPQSYCNGFSEFMINYQGGFVRRGLLGEILFFFAKSEVFDLEQTLKVFCLLCFLAVCVFFVRSFLKRGYLLYILPLCIFLGMGASFGSWTRKDYFLMGIFILVFWMLNKKTPWFWKMLAMNAFCVFAILNHEAFALFTLPLVYLSIIAHYRAKGFVQAVFCPPLCLAPSIVALMAVVLMHGNHETAQTIWSAWQGRITIPPEIPTMGSSVNALAWSLQDAFDFHLHTNFCIVDRGVSSFVAWCFIVPTVYYIATNFLYAFRKDTASFTCRHRNILGALLIFQGVCLLPLFVVFSCDYVRLVFYVVASSYAVFLLTPLEHIEAWFPAAYVRILGHIHARAEAILPPSKTILALLMLFIGVPPQGFSIEWTFQASIAYNVLNILSTPFRLYFSVAGIPTQSLF